MLPDFQSLAFLFTPATHSTRRNIMDKLAQTPIHACTNAMEKALNYLAIPLGRLMSLSVCMARGREQTQNYRSILQTASVHPEAQGSGRYSLHQGERWAYVPDKIQTSYSSTWMVCPVQLTSMHCRWQQQHLHLPRPSACLVKRLCTENNARLVISSSWRIRTTRLPSGSMPWPR
jgi:hypothetical protein